MHVPKTMCLRTAAARRRVAHAQAMAYQYISPEPAREPPTAVDRAAGLITIGLIGVAFGLCAAFWQKDIGAILPPLAIVAFIVIDRLRRENKLRLDRIAISLAIGFDIGALLLPFLYR